MATVRFIVFFVLVSIISSLFVSCSSRIDPSRAINYITEKKWSAAQSDLLKLSTKDTINVEGNFVYAVYFLSDGNPDFNPDSAKFHIDKAIAGWKFLTPKQKERLDSVRIVSFRSKVDSVAFEEANKKNSIASYQYFLKNYPDSKQYAEAIELRDEVAYLATLRVNTLTAFKKYMDDYPGSTRVPAAKDHYNQLIFKEEKTTFETTTSSGRIDDYINFIQQHPTSSQASKAKNILYYLMRDEGLKRPASLDNDSLRKLDLRNKGYWIPFYKNGLYGFMNDDGAEVMTPQFQAIDSSYLCGNVTQDFIVTSAGVYSRSGVLLLKNPNARAIDLGKGFLNIIDSHCHTVVHQSGFQIGENCIDDARIIADQFVALKSKKGWTVFAINGKQLLPSSYEDISNVDKVIILKRYGKSIVVKASNVATTSATKPLDESLVFDEVHAWGEGNLWVKNGVLEGVISQDLQFIIPLDRQILVKTSFGFTKTKDRKIQVIGVIPELESQLYDNVHDYGDWLELISNKHSILYRVPQKKIVATNLDSAWMKNRVVFGAKNDSLNVYVGNNQLTSFEKSEPFTFIKSSDSVVYFFVPEKKSKTVYEASQGKKLFSYDFDDIEVMRDLFVFTKKNKKGILRHDGKVLQSAEYDAIIPASAGYLSLLKEKKFGLYDIGKQKLIKPQYERNVLPYAGNYFIAYKGSYGIITAEEEPVTGFDFDEIKYWNDTSAWVKKDFAWSILSIKDKTIKLSKIRSFQTIKDHDGEKIVRVQQENYFGVISNKKGVLVAPTFTEVLNIGSNDKPFYFTEKRVEEAGIYVVIYYNSDGKLVRKQVYEEEEYEKIYCEN